MREIKEGVISMNPRYFFVLKIIGVVFVSLAIVVVSIFLLNFIFFSVRMYLNATPFHPVFKEFIRFILFFPWLILIFDIFLIFILRKLLQRFQFAYQMPLLYFILIVLTIVVAFGFLVEKKTRFNNMMLNRMEMRKVPPPLDYMYRRATRPFPRMERFMEIRDRGIFLERP